MSLRPPTALLLLALAGAGCATAPPRVVAPAPPEMARAEAAIVEAERQATEGASPEATLHLQLAQDQLRMARQRLDRGDREQARLLLARAQADAELAAAYAQLARAQQGSQP